MILSPDQKFALLQYSYTKVPVHFTTLRWKLGNKGLAATERLAECEENAGGWMNEMSAGKQGKRRRENGIVWEFG